MKSQRLAPWWSMDGLVARAWTSSEFRALWKKRRKKDRCPVGLKPKYCGFFLPSAGGPGVRPKSVCKPVITNA